MVKKIITFLCLVLMVLWLPRTSVSGEIHRVLFADTPYPPYMVGELGQHPTGGISVELLRELFGRLGVEVAVELHPWKRTLKLAEFGKVDGIPLLMRNSERDRFLAFTEVLFESRELFHYRKDRFGRFSWQDYTDLEEYTIGLVSGYTYGPEFLQAVKDFNLKVKYANSSRQNLHMLYAGRVDLCLEEEMVARFMINENENWKDSLKVAPKPVSVYPYYMAVSKKSEAVALLEPINRIIADMKKDGTVNRLLGR
jgi:polar amino acid transport system substrate-binding protein